MATSCHRRKDSPVFPTFGAEDPFVMFLWLKPICQAVYAFIVSPID